MNRAASIAIFVIFTAGASLAAEAPPPTQACDEAAYVPGVDVNGRSVVPADLPHNGTVKVGTTVVPKMQTPRNRQIGNVEVGVELESFDRAFNPKPCAKQTQPKP